MSLELLRVGNCFGTSLECNVTEVYPVELDPSLEFCDCFHRYLRCVWLPFQLALLEVPSVSRMLSSSMLVSRILSSPTFTHLLEANSLNLVRNFSRADH